MPARTGRAWWGLALTPLLLPSPPALAERQGRRMKSALSIPAS